MKDLLLLQPQFDLDRPLSVLEYLHASCGASRRSLEPPRVMNFVLEGDSRVPFTQWCKAWRQVVAKHPGLRARVQGRCLHARWTTRHARQLEVRLVEGCRWDGWSDASMEQVEEVPLSVKHGPLVELIVAPGLITRLIFRVHHAAADGMGAIFALQELFRALRQEPLLGNNAGFSDTDLSRMVNGAPATLGPSPIYLTGGSCGTTIGDQWQRLTLPIDKKRDVLSEVAAVMARFAWRFAEGPVRVAVPVNLRRYMPGLHSTMNFTGVVYVPLQRGDTAQTFRRELQTRLERDEAATWRASNEALRSLPLPWLDRLVGRTRQNYQRRLPVETVMITNLGKIDLQALSCDAFTATNLYMAPISGNAFVSLSTAGEVMNILVGMPRVYASESRLEQLLATLRAQFTPVAVCSGSALV